MNEPIKIDRKLPPHELNARRNRKRIVTKLPGSPTLPSPTTTRSTLHPTTRLQPGDQPNHQPALTPNPILVCSEYFPVKSLHGILYSRKFP